MSYTFYPEILLIARESDRPTYNTAAVEQRTGVCPATFRAWERRYSFPNPRRVARNHRLYSDRDVAALRWLVDRTREGLSISHAVSLLQDLLNDPRPVTAMSNEGRPPIALAAELQRALEALDATGAVEVLAEAIAHYPLEKVWLRIVEPSLIEIRDRCRRGELCVLAQHFASSLIRRKLFKLLDTFETGRGRGLIFTASMAGDSDEIESLMLSVFLARRGSRVAYLGPNLSTGGLGDSLERHRPDALCLWANGRIGAKYVDELSGVVERVSEPRPILAFGGAAFARGAAIAAMPGTYLGPDTESALRTVEEVLKI